MNILCIYRATEFSPNMRGQDAAIIDSVAALLRGKGHEVTMVHEEELSVADCHGKSAVLTMARRKRSLDILSRLSIPVVNTPQSVARAAKRCEVLVSDEPTDFPLWVKKAEGYSQCPEDVVYVEDVQGLDRAVAHFRERGIERLFFSHHIVGDQIKFYGVRGTDFFSWDYSAGGFSKFGWEERNAEVSHYEFAADDLRRKADDLARATGLTVYGGDCIIGEDGTVSIIDLNDWPSFGPCLDGAADAVASLVQDREERVTVESTYKSNDTEEWLDKVLTRKVGFCLAKWFCRLGYHPNTVTVISMVLGALAGACFWLRADSSPGLLSNLLGVSLLLTANFLDSADGQLARMTGKKTRLGRILDGAAGDVWFISIYVALSMRLFSQPMPFVGIQWGWWGFVAAAVSGFVCHARQCNLADYYRTIHLFFLSGKPLDQFDTYESQRELNQATGWKDDPLWKFFLTLYVGYTKSQERQTPMFQRLLRRLRRQPGGVTSEMRDEFLRNSRPLMKWTNILTFNTRAIVLYASCLADVPWVYLAFEITVMSVLYLHMRHRHESFCRRMSSSMSDMM